jgi:hypothetical protein
MLEKGKPLDGKKRRKAEWKLAMKHLTVNEVIASYGFEGEDINF